jgi:hypothetical protein
MTQTYLDDSVRPFLPGVFVLEVAIMPDVRPWTKSDIAKIKEFAGKEPAEAIAKLLGRNTSSLRVQARKLKLSLRLQRDGVERPGRSIPPSAVAGVADRRGNSA